MQYWHSSFITNKVDVGLLVIGAPGAGKTEFCYHLIKYLNYYLVADDLVKVVKTHDSYKGFLCNNQFLGIIHHKKRSYIQVDKALKQGVISHVLYLYCQSIELRYRKKAQALPLPLIEIDVLGNSWHECVKQLQNILRK